MEAEPLVDDAKAWIANVLGALERVRQELYDPTDDDGWALGGVGTIRGEVERLRDQLR